MKQGFTLLELLVVIAIIGILSSIILVSYNGYTDKARIAKTLQWASSVNHSLGDRAAGAWTFDNINGATVYDDSGNNNNGTAFGGPAVVDGVVGKALSFDGNNIYVGCGSGVNLDMVANDFTVAVWAKATGGTYGKGIINKGGWGSIGYSIQQAYSPADKYYFVVRDSAGYKYVELGLSPVFDWTHIVGIKKANYIEAWVNGKKVGSWAGTIGSLSNQSKQFEIGRSAEPYYFNGFIDDVRIFSSALTQAQIQQHYADGLKTHQNLASLSF